ncbi:MAG: hypothetical protein D6712_08745 [Chloroflexi bacterium]|nr:MAG: hypothetical protein D6712_08745 [Chloroflexota bacterium]
MTEAFEKAKALLESQGSLSNEEVEKLVAEHGEMTDEEKMELEAARHKKAREADEEVTLEQYLEAVKTLDNAEEGSDEYKKAEAIVKKYESGG